MGTRTSPLGMKVWCVAVLAPALVAIPPQASAPGAPQEVRNPTTDLEQTVAPVPWGDAFQLGVGIDAVTGGTSGVAVKPFSPRARTVKSTHEEVNAITDEKNTIGESRGRRMLTSRRTAPAPSMRAASITEGEMFCRPARKITTFRPSDDQMVTMQTASRASRESCSQFGGSMWKIFAMVVESTPSTRNICCQIIAMIPGISRSGATILGGELLGVERKAATEFTFYLAVPTMLGATVYELYKKGAALSSAQSLNIAVGFVVSFIVAFIVIRAFLTIVGKYGLRPFGYYRIAASLALMAYLAFH